ncbi:uncharacterized protein LOC144123116 isoform X2 [Amblyomma americanum]
MAATTTTNLPLLCVLIAMVCLLSTADTNLPELKPYLSEHQDSFKALSQPRYFVMLQRSFEHDPGFFWDGDCIYGRMFDIYPEEKCVMGIVLHWSSSSNTIVNRTVYTTVETTEGYSLGNAYTSSPMSSCEMWVLLDKIDEVNSLCFFIYDLLCGAQKFVTYDQEKCRNKTIIY